jgi:hypothetical protein
MPEVMDCQAEQCAYNREGKCHACAITIGDADQHLCDTAMPSTDHTRREETAGVGACRSTNCAHNADLECQAEGIHVAFAAGMASCSTFEKM